MRLPACLFLLAVFAAPTLAQSPPLPLERYRPLEVGDRWRYLYRHVSQGRTGTSNVLLYHDIEVVADTVIASSPRRVVVCRLRDRDYVLQSVARYHVARTDSATLHVVHLRGSGCELPLATVPPDAVYRPEDYTEVSNVVEEPSMITIRGVEYAVLGYRSRYYSMQHVGVSSAYSRESFVADIGPTLDYFQSWTRFGSSSTLLELEYARVGGQEWGIPPAPSPPVEAYRPLAVGDSWVYSLRTRGAGTSCTAPASQVGYVDLTVTGQADDRQVVECQRRLVDRGAVGPPDIYHVLVNDDQTLDALHASGPGLCQMVLPDARPDEAPAGAQTISQEPGSISIGGAPVTLRGVRGWTLVEPLGSGGERTTTVRLGADVGPVYHSVVQTAGATCEERTLALEHGIVGGTSYGAPLPSYANVADYRPLGLGYRWQYDESVSPTVCNAPVSGYREITVVSDTLVASVPRWVAECRRAGLDGQVTSVSRYHVGVGMLGELDAVPISTDQSCPLVLADVAPGVRPADATAALLAEPTSVVVGGQVYSGSGLRSWSRGEPTGGHQQAFALGIGPLLDAANANSPCRTSQVELRFAQVGEATYGVPIGLVPPPGDPAALTLTASPVPAARTLTLRLSGASEASVEVYDATGRRIFSVEAGRGDVELNVSGWATGVYTARAIHDGRAVTTRFVVAR